MWTDMRGGGPFTTVVVVINHPPHPARGKKKEKKKAVLLKCWRQIGLTLDLYNLFDLKVESVAFLRFFTINILIKGRVCRNFCYCL